MEQCLGDLNMKICAIYLDDLIIFLNTLEEHLDRLDKDSWSYWAQMAVCVRSKKPSIKTQGPAMTPSSSKQSKNRNQRSKKRQFSASNDTPKPDANSSKAPFGQKKCPVKAPFPSRKGTSQGRKQKSPHPLHCHNFRYREFQ